MTRISYLHAVQLAPQEVFRRLTNPTLKKLYRFVLKRLVGRFLDDDITLEVRVICQQQKNVADTRAERTGLCFFGPFGTATSSPNARE